MLKSISSNTYCWLGVIVLAFFISGCSPNIKQPVNPDVFYKREIKLNVNGVRGVGVVVVPESDTYKIVGESPGDIHMAIIYSCHRDIDPEISGDEIRALYHPLPNIEVVDRCALRIGLFDKSNGEHSFGQIVFEDRNGVPAKNFCNGVVSTGKTSVCQAASGLIQELHFTEEMIISPDDGLCNVPEMERKGKIFRYKIPVRECILSFAKVSDPSKTHDLYTVGWQERFLRK